MSTPNAVLAYAVLDQIDAHPEEWDQSTWDCGAAGWAVRLSDGVIDRPDHPDDSFVPTVVSGPKGMVGLPVDEAAALALGHECENVEQEDLFDSFNTRADLGRLVAEIFGPRPDAAA